MAEERSYDPQKRFMEELILRFERVVRNNEKALDLQNKAIIELTAEIREHRREFQKNAREAQEEYEAHRGTLLAILDRLNLIDPREGPATAG